MRMKLLPAMFIAIESCSLLMATELARWGFNEGKGCSSADISAGKNGGWTVTMYAQDKRGYPFAKELWSKEGDTPRAIAP